MSRSLKKELARAIANEAYDITNEGIYFPVQSALLRGEYVDSVNGGPEVITCNTIVDEGIAFLLSVALAQTAKPAGFYLAPFSGSATPAQNWTASNFASVASEIVSQAEGYTAATRPVWTPPASVNATQIDNYAAKASVTIATATSLNVNGIGLLTNSTRGGTTGALISAAKYSATRVLQNGDVWDIGYRISLTV